MELIAAVFLAGPLGYFFSPRKRAVLVYLGLWAVIFPIQTVIVFSEDGSDKNTLYFVFNALILCLGLGLNRLGSMLGERRRARLASA